MQEWKEINQGKYSRVKNMPLSTPVHRSAYSIFHTIAKEDLEKHCLEHGPITAWFLDGFIFVSCHDEQFGDYWFRFAVELCKPVLPIYKFV